MTRKKSVKKIVAKSPVAKKQSIAKLQIDKDIPFPINTRASKTDSIDFDRLKVGHSVYIDFVSRSGVAHAARKWANEMLESGAVTELPKFVYADERDGFRMWRKK